MTASFCLFVCLAARLRGNRSLDIDAPVDGIYNEESMTGFKHNSTTLSLSEIPHASVCI